MTQFTRIILITLLFFSLYSCQDNRGKKIESFISPVIFSYSDQSSMDKYINLELDSIYPNLFNQQAPPKAFKEVQKSWITLHKDLNQFLIKNNFSWNTSDSAISILHKIYFQKDGAIKYHFFRIFNPGITENKQVEFANLLFKFDSSYHIDLKRDSIFAQCGKAKYPNNSELF